MFIESKKATEIDMCYDDGNQIAIREKASQLIHKFNKNHGRYDFTADSLTVMIVDAVYENNWYAVTNTLEDGDGVVISDTSTAADRIAVDAYLSPFVGV